MPRQKENEAERDEMFQRGMIWCFGHNEYHYHSKFSPGRGNYGYAWKCKAWLNEYQRRSGITKSANKKRLRTYHKRKVKLVNMLGGKCARCGHSDIWGLDFHHVLPSEKENNISLLLGNVDFERTKIEADKCILLCKNCHASLGKSWEADFAKIEYGWILD